MVRTKRFPIHLVGEHNPPVGIHRPVQLDRRAVVAVWLRRGQRAIAMPAEKRKARTSLSAPSMQTYFALRRGFALRRMSAIIGPVNRAVDRPAEPHEKPFDLRTMFCSLRRFPAHTSVMGDVIWSNCCRIWRKLRTIGFCTSLSRWSDTS